MLFNSLQFLVFFGSVLGAYHLLGRHWKLQNLMLLVASYVFYGAWDWRFLSLLWISTLTDFVIAQKIEQAQSTSGKKQWLILSLACNLGILGFFKYCGFFVESFADLLGAVGFEANIPTLKIILPVGISFYTFQTISYTVDVYREDRKATRDPLGFALFVSYFPQLVAGPIERSTRLLPQLQGPRKVTRQDWSAGLMWMLQGYFLKVVVADSVAPLVDEAFSLPGEVSGSVSLLAIFGFALQIYGDFAGYTLIARGASRMMGISLMRNFNSPYLARGPRDFWRRWHISLSEWLRLYLYIPLGGSRNGRWLTYRNLMVTMLLGGFWHGAAWTFLIWGGYHGLLLIAAHATCAKLPSATSRAGTVAAICGTLILTMIGWLIFRASGVENLFAVTTNIFTNFHLDWMTLLYAKVICTLFAVVLLLDVWQERDGEDLALLRCRRWLRILVVTFMLASIISIGFRPQPFIYFQF